LKTSNPALDVRSLSIVCSFIFHPPGGVKHEQGVAQSKASNPKPPLKKKGGDDRSYKQLKVNMVKEERMKS
jgi:hypothetical protein